jgi:hypothetical protein
MSNERRNLVKRRNRLLKKVQSIGPFIEGSLVETRVKCGNKSCKCAKGDRHSARLFTWKEEGKTRTIYASKALYPKISEAWNEYLKLKNVIKEMSKVQVELFKLEMKERGERKKQS